MKVAFIHDEKKINTGAHYINDLISTKLRAKGVTVQHFYPTANLIETSKNLKGVANILFFYSLLEHREQILKCDLIQGTTYTPLTFLPFDIPIISHFGSTTRGMLDSVPTQNQLEPKYAKIWRDFKNREIIDEVQLKSRKPLRDIADIEQFVARRVNRVVATSQWVKTELIVQGVPGSKIEVVHNAVEDYWFEKPLQKEMGNPRLVFLGRLGNDVFNFKLKGLDRLIHYYRAFPKIQKISFGITKNPKVREYLNKEIPAHYLVENVVKDKLPKYLNPLRGSILFISSRYEGFSLSLIEGMSQGLIPIVYNVGVAQEVIENGKNGFMVKNLNQAIDITKKLLRSPAMRKRISANAYKKAQEFTADKMAENFLRLYEKVAVKKEEAKPTGWSRFFKK